MTRGPLVNREIVGVRLRLGWFGRRIVQIQRRQCRMRFNADGSPYWEAVGNSAWRDMNRDESFDTDCFLRQAVHGTESE